MAKKLMELRQRKAELVAAARNLLDRADAEARDMTTSEVEEFGKLDKEAQSVAEHLARHESLVELERRLAEGGETESATEPDPGDRFESFGEFLAAVAKAESSRLSGRPFSDPRLLAAPSGLGESSASDGGFLVGKDMQAGLVERIYELGEIAGRVSRIPISANSNGVKINAIRESSRANGSRWGGVLGYWTNEAGLLTGTKPKFRQISLDLEKLTGLAYATDELLADSAALEAVITKAFNQEFVFKLEDAIYNGTGAGQPLGVMTSSARVSVAKEGSQAAATIVLANIVKMWSRCFGRNRRNAIWTFNQDCEPQLLQLAAADSSPVWLTRGVVADAPPVTIFGRPAIPIEYAATLGTEGDIMLADWSEYLVAEKTTIRRDASMHVRFLYDEMTFRFVWRVDGEPAWDEPLTPYKGTNTLSPFVTLATRA